ncbi:MAG TPA: hypothetical protein VFO10_18925 [Oligoflexus sp.]|uniref:hypothetical protein n=1 Tax=Oligoflexus sp. TaxID=1971216 RepID=UPI002D7F9CDB|nr:hypothetical protein [Oligoflexus sp.]HET9239342.1 hypothetical protein [Oligoflexus sp.]
MRLGIMLSVILFALSEPAISQSRASSKKDTKPVESPEDKAQRLRPGWAASFELGIPHPVDIGFGYMQPKADSHIGSFGLFQRNIASGRGVRNIKLSMQHLEYRFRSEPSERHPLFWQVAGGYQEIQVDGTKSVTLTQDEITFTTDIQGSLKIRSLYWTPKVGITKHFMNGLTLSWGFGYMIPALVTSDFSSRVPDDPLVDELLQAVGSYQLTKRELERIGKRVGQLGIPHVDIIDVIWRF